MKPVLFLDVDGVLNALGGQMKPGTWTSPWGDHVMRSINRFPVNLSQRCADALMGLDVEIHWLTSWGELANDYICPVLGWSRLPVDSEHMAYRWSGDSKAAAVRRHVETDRRPFVWLDDEAIPYDRSWMDPVPNLLIEPSDIDGLTPAHIDQVRSFIERLPA